MSKLLKIVGGIALALVTLVVIGAVAVFFSSNSVLRKKFAVTPRAVAIPAGAEAIERGRHLAMSRGCVDCHGKDLGGNKIIDGVPMGKVFGPNLTSGRGGL